MLFLHVNVIINILVSTAVYLFFLRVFRERTLVEIKGIVTRAQTTEA
jgi:hypothetical protein